MKLDLETLKTFGAVYATDPDPNGRGDEDEDDD